MRPITALPLCLIGLAAVVLPPVADAAQMTVTGCLAADAKQGRYDLTNAQGGDAAEYHLIIGPGFELPTHVGQKIELVGELASPTEEASYGGGKHLKARMLKHIADKCP